MGGERMGGEGRGGEGRGGSEDSHISMSNRHMLGTHVHVENETALNICKGVHMCVRYMNDRQLKARCKHTVSILHHGTTLIIISTVNTTIESSRKPSSTIRKGMSATLHIPMLPFIQIFHYQCTEKC